MKYTEQYNNCLNTHSEYLTDKCWPHSYGPKVYDDLFEPIQHTVRNYLEIGTAYGGSALLARDYFTLADIWTVDQVAPNRRLRNIRRIITVTCDAYQKKIADMFPAQMDIIIEDGSHTITDQQRSIDLYLEKLNIGGYFIIEDIEVPEKSFKLFDKRVDLVLESLQSRGNKWLEYEVSTYIGPEFFLNDTPGREEYAKKEIEEFGRLTRKSKNDNLYIVKRVS